MPDSLERQRRRFRVVLPATVAGCALFAVLLEPALFPLAVRQAASGLGLIVSGVFLAVSCWSRARRTVGRRRRSWLLIMAGAIVAITGNVWATAIGSDPVTSPSAFSDLTITAALGLCIAGVLGFPSVRRRGVDLVVISLDGLVVGGAVLIISSTLVYDELLDQTRGGLASELATLLIPVLDVVLVVVGILLLLRARGSDRRALALLALGFFAYVLADLAFAVLVAQEDFEFGSPLDLGWMAGYALLALAAWYPSTEVDVPHGSGTATDVRDTALVYFVLLLAGGVQVLSGSQEGLKPSTAVLWLLVAIAAAGRQVVLTRDNNALRRGLEQRVSEQTSDLRRLVRQTEVLLTSVGDGIYGVDADGRITFVNPSCTDALQYAADDLLGQPQNPSRRPGRSLRTASPFCCAVARSSAWNARILSWSSGSTAARIRTASRPALRAPPTATVATGTPAGIWTIESSESRPSRFFSGTGTPITGSGVTAASMPGRWAAPPAPAMITASPRSAASRP